LEDAGRRTSRASGEPASEVGDAWKPELPRQHPTPTPQFLRSVMKSEQALEVYIASLLHNLLHHATNTLSHVRILPVTKRLLGSRPHTSHHCKYSGPLQVLGATASVQAKPLDRLGV
jgi:hypothetical protein